MLNENDPTMSAILETVTFIKDHAVTQKEFSDGLAAMRTDLVAVMDTKFTAMRTDLVAVMDTKFTAMRTDLVAVMDTKNNVLADRLISAFEERLSQKSSEVVTHVDAFAALHQKLEQELTALRGKYERLEERLERLERQFPIAHLA